MGLLAVRVRRWRVITLHLAATAYLLLEPLKLVEKGIEGIHGGLDRGGTGHIYPCITEQIDR